MKNKKKKLQQLKGKDYFVCDFINFQNSLLDDCNKSNIIKLVNAIESKASNQDLVFLSQIVKDLKEDKFNNIYEPLEEIVSKIEWLDIKELVNTIKFNFESSFFEELIDLDVENEEFNWSKEVIDFIERNFDLSKKTGGYNL